MVKINYCPPDTDSDSEYDGFSFGDDFHDIPKPTRQVVHPEQRIYDAIVLNPDLEILKDEIDRTGFEIDSPIKESFTLLLYACSDGHVDIVRYLIEERKANVNKQIDSYTPLMQACACTKDTKIVTSIVKLLLKHGAVINVSDKYGVTPFMLACKNGHTNVVQMLLKDVSFDAVDNQGYTAIFHAIQNNHRDIVKALIDAGVNLSVSNNRGYYPRQMVQVCGFYDLLDLFPKEKECYNIAPKCLNYNVWSDYIPRIFPKTDCPEYFQEINFILNALKMDKLLEYFAKANCSLEQFLLLDDEQLFQIGIKLPIYRMKLQIGLLDFHLHHWTLKSIARVTNSLEGDFYNTLIIAGNQLQKMIIIRAALCYIRQQISCDRFGSLSISDINGTLSTINRYNARIKDLKKTTKLQAALRPRRNPMYINYDDYLAAKKRKKINRFLKYTTVVLGFSALICLKLKS